MMTTIKKDDPTAAITLIAKPEADPRISDTTRRLIADFSKAMGAEIEVLIVHPKKGKLNLTEEPDHAVPAKAKPTVRAAAKPPVTSKKLTVAARLRELISQKLSDDEIWPKIKTEYGLADNKRSYIAGQRRVLERKAANG